MFPDPSFAVSIPEVASVIFAPEVPVSSPHTIVHVVPFQSKYDVVDPILNFGVPESDPSQNPVSVSAYVDFPDRTTHPEERVIDPAYIRAVLSSFAVIVFAAIFAAVIVHVAISAAVIVPAAI